VNLVWLLFSFNGRINRVQFWLGCVLGGVAGAMLLFVLALGAPPLNAFAKPSGGIAQVLTTASFMFGAPLLLMSWIGAALQTKRLHDRGRSALWMMAPMLPALMVVFSLVSTAAQILHAVQVGAFAGGEVLIAAAMASAGMWMLILTLVHLFMFVDLGCMPGKPGQNKYGNPPGGGFTGGGAPMSGASILGTSAPSRAQAMMPGTGGSTLTSAESAIEKAIAARSKQQAAPVVAPVLASRPAAPSAPQSATALRTATAGSFGRKAAR
jgi:uncharacterized membrane protein YhaH (DUF805 family)